MNDQEPDRNTELSLILSGKATIMSESHFKFKKFEIYQDRCAMKVGTDGVLLGSWIQPEKNIKRILDIGTGTGLLALMLAQKTESPIDAIDIDKSSVDQASENFHISPWNQRLNAIHCSLQNFIVQPSGKYDLIVSNPPFFRDSYKTEDNSRTIARHTDQSLSYNDLIYGVASLLSESGIFYLILPFNEGQEFIRLANEKGIHACRQTRVLTRQGKPPKRVLMSFRFKSQEAKEDELIIQNGDGSFSLEYLELTRDYYLALKSHRQV